VDFFKDGARGETMDAILTGYIERALSRAEYDKLEDGTFSGRIPGCKGVIAFGDTLRNCESELRSVLEDWVLVGLKLGHSLPVMDGYDLNREPSHEPMEAV
jgi:predicted RNase H-like HicB family nuclease